MSGPSYSWFYPSYGPGSNVQNEEVGLEEMISTVKILEDAGFGAVLTASDSNSYDPWMVSSNILQATKKLNSIIALRTGFIEPVYAARMISTLDQLSKGRVELNIVTGSSMAELGKEGSVLDHRYRYERTAEFMEILTNLFSNHGPVKYTGSYYKIINATLFPKMYKIRKPKIYIAGSSVEAKGVASRYGSVYIFWAEPLELVKNHIEAVSTLNSNNKSLEYGLRVNILIRKSKQDAVEELEKHIKKAKIDPRKILPLVSKYSDSIGQKRMNRLAQEQKMYDSNLYTGAIGARTGSVPFLVGSAQEVRDTLLRYMELGIKHFIFASKDSTEESMRIGEEINSKLK
jgi:alkanesulfonate monooxygenase